MLLGIGGQLPEGQRDPQQQLLPNSSFLAVLSLASSESADDHIRKVHHGENAYNTSNTYV